MQFSTITVTRKKQKFIIKNQEQIIYVADTQPEVENMLKELNSKYRSWVDSWGLILLFVFLFIGIALHIAFIFSGLYIYLLIPAVIFIIFVVLIVCYIVRLS